MDPTKESNPQPQRTVIQPSADFKAELEQLNSVPPQPAQPVVTTTPAPDQPIAAPQQEVPTAPQPATADVAEPQKTGRSYSFLGELGIMLLGLFSSLGYIVCLKLRAGAAGTYWILGVTAVITLIGAYLYRRNNTLGVSAIIGIVAATVALIVILNFALLNLFFRSMYSGATYF